MWGLTLLAPKSCSFFEDYGLSFRSSLVASNCTLYCFAVCNLPRRIIKQTKKIMPVFCRALFMAAPGIHLITHGSNFPMNPVLWSWNLLVFIFFYSKFLRSRPTECSQVWTSQIWFFLTPCCLRAWKWTSSIVWLTETCLLRLSGQNQAVTTNCSFQCFVSFGLLALGYCLPIFL